jgi:hypothetical protein
MPYPPERAFQRSVGILQLETICYNDVLFIEWFDFLNAVRIP